MNAPAGRAAIDAALATSRRWSHLPWEERVAPFLRAADLLQYGPWRARLKPLPCLSCPRRPTRPTSTQRARRSTSSEPTSRTCWTCTPCSRCRCRACGTRSSTGRWRASSSRSRQRRLRHRPRGRLGRPHPPLPGRRRHTEVLTKILTKRLETIMRPCVALPWGMKTGFRAPTGTQFSCQKSSSSGQTRRSPVIQDGVSEGTRTPDTQDHNLVL
jgi:hypothetical protein